MTLGPAASRAKKRWMQLREIPDSIKVVFTDAALDDLRSMARGVITTYADTCLSAGGQELVGVPLTPWPKDPTTRIMSDRSNLR